MLLLIPITYFCKNFLFLSKLNEKKKLIKDVDLLVKKALETEYKTSFFTTGGQDSAAAMLSFFFTLRVLNKLTS